MLHDGFSFMSMAYEVYAMNDDCQKSILTGYDRIEIEKTWPYLNACLDHFAHFAKEKAPTDQSLVSSATYPANKLCINSFIQCEFTEGFYENGQ